MATMSPTTLVQTLRPLLKQTQLADLPGTVQAQPNLEALARDLCQRGWLTPFQARQVLQGKGAGLVLGPYILLDLLGSGGAGHVFKARHRTMDRLVALKVLQPNLLADAEAVNRFFREIEVISQFDHPAIVHAYDAGAVGKTYYLAMEFVEGVDLERLVADQGPLAPALACDYVRQAAEGLQYAHERGLVHRDIKPSNLLATKGPGQRRQGMVKIMDLGLARLQEPVQGSRTRNLTVLAGGAVMQGTPDYMAPEQALDFHNASTSADIYSLGCTFYFLLTGQPPFGGATLVEKLVRHQQMDPPALDTFRQDLPPEVGAVVRRMMSKQPADRYATPGECAAALAAVLGSLAPLSAPGDSTVELQQQLTPASGLLALPPAEPAPPSRRRAWPRWCLPVLAAAGLLGALYLGAILLRPLDRREKPSLTFSGNELIALPKELFRKPANITLEAWFKTKTGGVIFGYQRGPFPTGGGSYVPAVHVGTDGRLRAELWFAHMRPVVSAGPVNDDQWHHVCLTADSNAKTQSLYLDGLQIGTISGPLVPLDMTDNQVGTGLSTNWPGGNGGWHGFQGCLTEVRVWHRTLTGEEVETQRNRPLVGDEPGLVAYFPLDEREGDIVLERVTNTPTTVQRAKLDVPLPARLPTGPPVR